MKCMGCGSKATKKVNINYGNDSFEKHIVCDKCAKELKKEAQDWNYGYEEEIIKK